MDWFIGIFVIVISLIITKSTLDDYSEQMLQEELEDEIYYTKRAERRKQAEEYSKEYVRFCLMKDCESIYVGITVRKEG